VLIARNATDNLFFHSCADFYQKLARFFIVKIQLNSTHMKKDEVKPEDIKTDLKHDTMDFSAPTDGEDALDTDDERYEEDGISADELELLEGAPDDEEAAALNSVEMDLQTDEDILPEEDWVDDIEDDGPEDETMDTYERN
jgi:hypothetical protein